MSDSLMSDTQLQKPVAVLFDWDNTLVDTWPVIHAAMNALFREFEMEEWTIEETKARVRHSMRDAFPVLFGDEWERARDIFYACFEAVHLDALTARPGAEELLISLRDADLHLGIVSNKQGKYLRKEVEALGWNNYFHTLVGAGDAERDNPAPHPLDLAMMGSRYQKGDTAWYVGDTDVDMEFAHGTGLFPILVRDEPNSDGEFDHCPPSLHCDNLVTLRAIVERTI